MRILRKAAAFALLAAWSLPAAASAAPVGPDQSWCVVVPGAASGSLAMTNLTNTNADGRGYGTLRTPGTTPTYRRVERDRTSSVNFAKGTPPDPNLAIGAVESASICYDTAVSTSNVIVDLAAVIPPGAVRDATATRILDTRSGVAVAAETSRCVEVPGASPGDTAIINITNTQASGRGYGALRASDATPIYDRPTTNQYSSVNFAANTPPNPNLAVTAVGPDAKICYDGAVSAHHTILDLVATASSETIPAIEPSRLLDTRPAPGSVSRSQVLNQTLPVGTCGWIGERLGLRLRNGSITGEFPSDGMIEVISLALQDLDGDGIDDAAFVIICNGGGTAVNYEFFLRHAASGTLAFGEGDLVDSTRSGAVRLFGFVEDFKLNGPSVVVRWSGKTQFDANCCASLLYESQVFSNGTEPPTILTTELES
jgi:hypothetical protein